MIIHQANFALMVNDHQKEPATFKESLGVIQLKIMTESGKRSFRKNLRRCICEGVSTKIMQSEIPDCHQCVKAIAYAQGKAKRHVSSQPCCLSVDTVRCYGLTFNDNIDPVVQ